MRPRRLAAGAVLAWHQTEPFGELPTVSKRAIAHITTMAVAGLAHAHQLQELHELLRPSP